MNATTTETTWFAKDDAELIAGRFNRDDHHGREFRASELTGLGAQGAWVVGAYRANRWLFDVELDESDREDTRGRVYLPSADCFTNYPE